LDQPASATTATIPVTTCKAASCVRKATTVQRRHALGALTANSRQKIAPLAKIVHWIKLAAMASALNANRVGLQPQTAPLVLCAHWATQVQMVRASRVVRAQNPATAKRSAWLAHPLILATVLCARSAGLARSQTQIRQPVSRALQHTLVSTVSAYDATMVTRQTPMVSSASLAHLARQA
jgi:hypothetical protein